MTTQRLPHGNFKQGRVRTIACHSHAGKGGGNYTNSQGKSRGLYNKQSKAKGLYNGLDKTEQTNKERCSEQTMAATSAGEVRQAEGRTSPGGMVDTLLTGIDEVDMQVTQ